MRRFRIVSPVSGSSCSTAIARCCERAWRIDLGHFMNPALLDSQVETLERPADALVVDIAEPVDAQVAGIRGAFGI